MFSPRPTIDCIQEWLFCLDKIPVLSASHKKRPATKSIYRQPRIALFQIQLAEPRELLPDHFRQCLQTKVAEANCGFAEETLPVKKPAHRRRV